MAKQKIIRPAPALEIPPGSEVQEPETRNVQVGRMTSTRQAARDLHSLACVLRKENQSRQDRQPPTAKWYLDNAAAGAVRKHGKPAAEASRALADRVAEIFEGPGWPKVNEPWSPGDENVQANHLLTALHIVAMGLVERSGEASEHPLVVVSPGFYRRVVSALERDGLGDWDRRQAVGKATPHLLDAMSMKTPR
jgi:hypothetical protein